MQIARPRKSLTTISIVPLVDIMLILLVFFMVTSTYLDLDMVPVAEKSEAGPDDTTTNAGADASRTLMIRLNSAGTPVLRGKPITFGSLALVIEARAAENQPASVIILPSRSASLQSLVSLMETANDAGAKSVRVVKLAPLP